MPVDAEPPFELLLIEDNVADAYLIEKYLGEASTALLPGEIESTHETSLSDGIDTLSEGSFDLLLLDLGLPESSGLETLDEALTETEDIPVVVLTGLQNQETPVEAIKQGAQDYLNKDKIDTETLTRAIRYAIERKEREIELQARTEQLEMLNRIVRHDITNDIAVIQGWIEPLAEDIDDEHEQMLQYVTDSTNHILDLTETVEDFLKSLTSDEEFDLEETDPGRILRDEIEKKRSVQENATFVIDGDLSSPDVRANKLLSSVFENLLANAVQHSNKETPRVVIERETTPSTVRVAIKDNGPGVPDGHKEAIFGKGEVGLESASTGIGLYLVHTLVEQYGGAVWVEDNHPDGAVFIVELSRVD